MTTNGILLSLIPLVAWGIGDYLSAIAAKNISPRVANFVFQMAGLPLSFVIAWRLGLPSINLMDMLVYVIAGLAFTGGFVLMMQGFIRGAVGIVSPIANAYSAITILLAITIFNATFTAAQLAMMALIIFGIVLVSYEKPDKRKSKKRIQTAVVFALFSMLCFGTGFGILETIDGYTWYQNMLLLHIAVVVIAFIDIIAIKGRKAFVEMRRAMSYKLGLIGGVLGTIGTLGFFGAFETLGSVVIPAVIASASPLVTSFIAHRYEHEHLTWLQRTGSIAVVAGVILLNVV